MTFWSFDRKETKIKKVSTKSSLTVLGDSEQAVKSATALTSTTAVAVSAIPALFLNCNVKSLIFHFLTTNTNGKNILLEATHFNFKIAYFSKAAFTTVYYIFIGLIWKNGFNSQVKLENTGLIKGKTFIVIEIAHQMSLGPSRRAIRRTPQKLMK